MKANESPESVDDVLGQMDLAEAKREWEARQEYITWRCTDMPSHYSSMIPICSDVKILLQAETQIRAMMADDLEKMQRERQNPWIPQTTKPKLMNFEKLTSDELVKLGLTNSRMMGMPAAFKPGFHDHPEVKAAFERAPLTAERIAYDRLEQISKQYQDAARAYAAAANAGEPSDKVAKLEADYNELMQQHTAARAECDRLSKDPAAACTVIDGGEQIGTDDRGPHLAE